AQSQSDVYRMMSRQLLALQMGHARLAAVRPPPRAFARTNAAFRSEIECQLPHSLSLIEYLLNQSKRNRRRRAVGLLSGRFACARAVTGAQSAVLGPLTARSQAHGLGATIAFFIEAARPTSPTAATTVFLFERGMRSG